MEQAAPTRVAYAGRVLDNHYRLEEKVGGGGFGQVWRATNVRTRQQVAVKLLRAQDGSEVTDEMRFLAEATILSQLHHPNTVRVYDLGQADDGTPFIVMEYVKGVLLSKLRKDNGGKLQPGDALRIIEQIARAVEEAHALGIVHRDLKPENVIVCDYQGDIGFAKVLDFGIAKLAQSLTDPQLTGPGMVLGTARYMAPEQASGGTLDGRSDLYSLGVILFELLSGVPPFNAAEPVQLIVQKLTQPAPPLSDVLPGVEPALEAFVARLLARNPAERPDRASDVVNEIAALRRESVPEGDTELVLAVRPTPWWAWGGLALAIAAVSAALVAVLVSTPKDGSPPPPPPPPKVRRDASREVRAMARPTDLGDVAIGAFRRSAEEAAERAGRAALEVARTSASVEWVTVVTTDPVAAQVFVNGQPRGETPYRVSWLSSARPPAVKVSAPGYLTQSVRLWLDAGPPAATTPVKLRKKAVAQPQPGGITW